MPVGDMPILQIILHQMRRAGVAEVILTVSHLAGLLQAFFADGSRFGIKIRYSYEEKPLGTAGPLSMINDLDDTFLVANGDVLTTLNLNRLVDFHHRNGGIATIATHMRRIYIDLGVIRMNSAHEIIGYTEKPVLELPVSMGIYVFEPRILEYIEHDQYLDFPDLAQRLIERGERIVAYPFDGYWQDLGRVEDYEQAVQDFETLRDQIWGDGSEPSFGLVVDQERNDR